MTDMIRLELSGKSSQAFERVFDKLSAIVTRALEAMVPTVKDEETSQAHSIAADLVEMSKSWLKAKFDKPILDNQRTVADICYRLEAIKSLQVTRRSNEIENERAELKLWEERLTVALRWMAFLSNHVVRNDDGSVTLLLTNRDMISLQSDLRNLEN